MRPRIMSALMRSGCGAIYFTKINAPLHAQTGELALPTGPPNTDESCGTRPTWLSAASDSPRLMLCLKFNCAVNVMATFKIYALFRTQHNKFPCTTAPEHNNCVGRTRTLCTSERNVQRFNFLLHNTELVGRTNCARGRA